MSQDYEKPTTSATSSPSSDQPKIANNTNALLTNFSGSSSPTSPVAGQHWFDTTTKILYVRNASNDGWGRCSNPENTKAINGAVSIDASYDGMTCLAQNTSVITLPNSASVNPDFYLEIFVYDNTTLTIQGNGGETFYRDGALLSSTVIPTDSANTFLKIAKWGPDGKFFIAGNLKGVDSDLSTLTNVGKKQILDLFYPVGSTYMTYSNTAPPLQGILGVSWSALSEGCALETGNTSNTGTFSGVHRLDTGTTTGHSLSQAELPAASITISGSAILTPVVEQDIVNLGNDATGFFQQFFQHQDSPTTISYKTVSQNLALSASGTINGSNVAHTHPLNVRNYKILTYVRDS